MADPQLYTALYIMIDNVLLAESVQVSMQRMSNATQVLTMAKGLAGITLGAAMANFSVSNVIPSSDYEMDMGQAILTGKVIEFTFIGPGGKQAVCKGFVTEDTSEHGVNSNAGYSFSGFAAMPLFQ